MKLIDLTIPFGVGTPPWPTYIPLEVKYFKRLAPNGANGQVVTHSNHVGTHLDGEIHFYTPGKDIAQLELDFLVNEGVIVDLSDAVGDYEVYTSKMVEERVEVKEGDILIIHTGYHHFGWDQPTADEIRYMVKHPGPDREFAEWAKKKKLRWLGVLVVIVLVADPAVRIVEHNILITKQDTRLTSSTWLKERIPKNTGLLFPNPLIFGRPWASFRYPNRVSLPRKASILIWREILSSPPAGLEVVIIDEHPLAYSSVDPKVITLLDERADLVYHLDSARPGRSPAVYDPYDAYYVPLAGFNRVKVPGPSIRIYRLP